MNDKLIDRIKKLLALSSNNSNENEANSALRMARKLLDKNNLSMYDLSSNDKVSVKIEDNSNLPWIRTIYNSISMLYDTKYVVDKSTKPVTHLIIGLESNRVTASIIIDYVIKEIRASSVGMGNHYRNAAALEIQSRVYEIINERRFSEEEVIPGTGLVPVDVSKMMNEKNQDWINEQLNTVKGKRSNIKYDNRGRDLGRGINLNPQLSNKIAIG